MKVHVGTMYRIVVERKCGCKATQEYLDAVLKEPDGEPLYKPCPKHRRGAMKDMVRELLLEVLEQKAEEQHSKAVIAAAAANADKRPGAPAAVGEGATSETRTPITAGNAVQRPAGQPPASATPAPAAAAGRRPPQPRRVNLASASGGGIRRAAAPPTAATAAAARTVPQGEVSSIDAELAGVPATSPATAAKLAAASPAAIAKVLVDDSEGGLMGDPEGGPLEEDNSR